MTARIRRLVLHEITTAQLAIARAVDLIGAEPNDAREGLGDAWEGLNDAEDILREQEEGDEA